MDRVQRLDPQRVWGDISVVLVDDKVIAGVNQRHLAVSEATDVISFCYAPLPGDIAQYSAEIIVNVQRASVEGRRRGRSTGERSRWDPSRELALYVAHGCDHLTTLDDANDGGRRRMRRRELRWLKLADGQGLVSGLISR